MWSPTSLHFTAASAILISLIKSATAASASSLPLRIILLLSTSFSSPSRRLTSFVVLDVISHFTPLYCRFGYPHFTDKISYCRFRVFKLDTSNIRAWNPDRDNLEKTLFDHEEHILPGRTEADIVYELLLKLGLDLCVPIESRTIAGKTVGAIGGGVLLACLAERIAVSEVETLAQGIVAWRKELTPAGDTTCVFRDSAFENDIAKSNLAAILEQYGIANVRSL